MSESYVSFTKTGIVNAKFFFLEILTTMFWKRKIRKSFNLLFDSTKLDDRKNDNFEFEILDEIECNYKTDKLRIEREYIEMCNANLNKDVPNHSSSTDDLHRE